MYLVYLLAFFDGWYSDEKCLARQGNANRRNYVLTGDQIIHVPGPTDVIELFNNNEVFYCNIITYKSIRL